MGADVSGRRWADVRNRPGGWLRHGLATLDALTGDRPPGSFRRRRSARPGPYPGLVLDRDPQTAPRRGDLVVRRRATGARRRPLSLLRKVTTWRQSPRIIC